MHAKLLDVGLPFIVNFIIIQAWKMYLENPILSRIFYFTYNIVFILLVALTCEDKLQTTAMASATNDTL